MQALYGDKGVERVRAEHVGVDGVLAGFDSSREGASTLAADAAAVPKARTVTLAQLLAAQDLQPLPLK